jgi:hypothetical protein
MGDIFFDVPFYKRLTSHKEWECNDKKETKYQICRAFFILKTRHKAGSAQRGRKLSVFGSPKGVAQDRLKSIELETEVFKQVESIKKSLVESGVIVKISTTLSNEFGDGKIFKLGGKVNSELSSSIKSSFSEGFHVTNSTRIKETIKYEFKDSVQSDAEDILCGVAAYQKCEADLYLLKIDFLNVIYEKSLLGLRKKIKKRPFPKEGANNPDNHPNVIKIGSYLTSLEYWELIPECSWVVKDADYAPDVENDSEITLVKKQNMKDRPYWTFPKHPTLYALSNVAFPCKWVNKEHSEYTKKELIDMELGEAEGTTWWFTNGPGKNRGA